MGKPRFTQIALRLSLVAIVAAACSGEESGSLSTAVDSLDVEETLVRFVGDAEGGAVVLTVCSGVETAAAVGVANAAGQPLNPQTPFRVGSISKTFIGVIILQLVDEGRIDLDRPVSDYLPEAIVGGDVTVRSLLNHRSGLPDFLAQEPFNDDVLAQRDRSFTPDEVLEYVSDLPARTPDRRFSYSNTNYVLLGQVVEMLDGVDLNTALQKRIAEPLDLDATVFASSGTVPEELAAGWSPGVLKGDPNESYESIATSAFAAGALVSTTDDLRRFLVALFEGDLVSEESLAEVIAKSVDGYGYGLGLGQLAPGGPAWLRPTPDGQLPAYGHNGDIFGYTAMMLIEPDTGNIVIALTNNTRLVADDAAPLIAKAAGCHQD